MQFHRLILSAFLISLSFASTAQWTINGTDVYHQGGTVVIGLTAGQGPFQVYGGNSFLWGLNLGFGTGLAVITTDASSKELSFQIGSTEYARLNSSGNLLLGETSQTNTAYKLDVNGPVRAAKVVVNTTGADFVFDSTYLLPSLEATEKYIRRNHHLQGIVTAGEMQRNGVDLGDNQIRLLQKIEELTLYNIEQDKKLKAQQAEIDSLKAMVKKIAGNAGQSF